VVSERKAEHEPGIDPATTVGTLSLSVADLQRSVTFYTDLIGLRVLSEGESSATLGVADDSFLELTECPGAQPWPRGGRSYPGLYHFAILLPTRVDLGRWLAHWLSQDMPLPGQGDHFVSEALYLEDPDGHGIEIYRDRPRDEWQWRDGQVQMGVEPVDIRGLLEEAQRSADPWTNMPVGTTLGHIHLQVSDITETARFYNQILGLDIVAQMPSALFMSAGGYHHHIGANIWHSKGAGPAPSESVNLEFFTIDFPDDDARGAAVDRLGQAGVQVTHENDDILVVDPSSLVIRLRVTP
jgi:catechol 2,3-dioxygenase